MLDSTASFSGLHHWKILFNSSRLLVLVTLGIVVSGLKPARAQVSEKLPVPQIVPWPGSIHVTSGAMRLKPGNRIIAMSSDLAPLATLLSDEIALVTGVRVAPGSCGTADDKIFLERDPSLGEEEYTLSVGQSAVVRGGSYGAVAAGTVTLLQVLVATGRKVFVPHMTVSDAPAMHYRGALIDLARKYHSPGGIEQVIELCRLYKIRFLQLHLTDDQLFMFPSKRFPGVGRSNREFARFDPPSKPVVEPYTLDELKHLERFASVRGVYLLPEIDMPGHSGRLVADAPELFGIPGNGSTVNIASPKTVDALTDLLNEVMDVFRSTPYVHIGADEVGFDGLDQTVEYRQALSDPTIKSVHDLYCRFVSQMCAVVTRRSKRPIVWEEAFNTEGAYPLPKDALVMSWSMGHDPNDVANAGYPVINAGWTPLYIVRNNKRSPEFMWKWSPAEFGREGSTDFTPLRRTSALAGAQICSWENSESIEIQSLRQRLPVVAERLWSIRSPGGYQQFVSRYAHTDAILDALVNPIIIKTAGQFSGDENTFVTPLTVTLTARRPGMTIWYTLDGSLPTAGWQPYTGRLTLTRTAFLRAGLFDGAGRQHGYLVGSWFRCNIPEKPNLATHRPVTVGPSPDRTDEWSASVAVDGHSDDPNRHWASVGPAPQWLQVDLGRVVPVSFIKLITYWDGSRYYEWNAEVSEDGTNWTRVLDFSHNTVPATSAGYTGRFAATPARYVRINMLKNSANPYVHIVELIVE